MSGKFEKISGTTTARRGPAKLLVGLAALALVAGAIAFVTIDPPPLPTRSTKKAGNPAPSGWSPQAPAFGNDVELPAPDAPLPPTTADLRKTDARSATPSGRPPASTSGTSAVAPAATAETTGDPTALSLPELKKQAEGNDLPSMIELARRLIEGDGIAKDPPAGAGWMMRAAELGSLQAAFNVGVMYEQGFVVERNSAKAAQWYRRAADAGLPAAQHNLALLLRAGKGVPRDQAQAMKLLLDAAHQGMAAAMFTLGDVYERGDAAPKDLPAAVAWYAVADQFERQSNDGRETPLSRLALQRSQALQRILTPAQLNRAQALGDGEYAKIIATMPAAGQVPQLPVPALPSPAPDTALAAATSKEAAGWPPSPSEQVRAVQQALFDLKLLRDKPDGMPGPMTNNAIRSFQRSVGMAETGDATKEVYVALKQALAKRAATAPGPTSKSSGQ